MKKLPLTFALAAFLPLGCGTGSDASEGAGSITIWWAEWDPAAGLQELGKQFEKETGIAVEVHQIPWSDFQTKAFLEFESPQTAFDIVVGDSQWIGRAVEEGVYLELTDWIGSAVAMDQVHRVAARYLCEYPTGSGRFYAAPCETDATGFAYRCDWFEDPAEKDSFEERYGRPLTVPQTWAELKDIAEFFHRPDEGRYGVTFPTGRGYDGATMSFQQIMWAFGGGWADDENRTQGSVNSPGSVQALELFLALLDLGPKSGRSSDYGRTVENFTNGSTAMMMNYFAFYPRILADEEVGGDRVGFFRMPTQDGRRGVSLGGQGMSISLKTTPAKQKLAKQFIAWFQEQEQQESWIAQPGCFTADTAILASEAFRTATPYNAAFADSLDHVGDFWNIPEFKDLLAVAQKYVGEAVDGKKTPREALDAIATEHEAILREAGLLKD